MFLSLEAGSGRVLSISRMADYGWMLVRRLSVEDKRDMLATKL